MHRPSRILPLLLLAALVAPGVLAAANGSAVAPNIFGLTATGRGWLVNCGGSVHSSPDGAYFQGMGSGSCSGQLCICGGSSSAALVGVDATTGTLSAIGNETANARWGLSATDAANGVFYHVDSARNLRALDMTTGALLSSVPLAVSPIALERDPVTGEMFALSWRGDLLVLVELDETTGSAREVAVAGNGGSVLLAISAYDPATRTFFYSGRGPVGTGVQRIDVDSGLVRPFFPPIPIVGGGPATKDLAAGRGNLYITYPLSSGGFGVSAYNQTTGLHVARVGSFPDVALLSWGVSSFDAASRTLTFAGEDADGTKRVYSLNVLSKRTESSGPLAQALSALSFA